MKQCPTCKAMIADNAAACPTCGQVFTTDGTMAILYLILIGTGVVVLIGAIGVVFEL